MIRLVAKKRKAPDERNTVTIECGETVAVIKAWDQGVLPHELVHYVVEAVFPLRGFVRATAAGEDTEELVARRDAQALRAENLTNAFQYELWGLVPANDETFRETLAANGAVADPVTAEEIGAGRALLEDLARRWSELGPGRSLELSLELSLEFTAG